MIGINGQQICRFDYASRCSIACDYRKFCEVIEAQRQEIEQLNAKLNKVLALIKDHFVGDLHYSSLGELGEVRSILEVDK